MVLFTRDKSRELGICILYVLLVALNNIAMARLVRATNPLACHIVCESVNMKTVRRDGCKKYLTFKFSRGRSTDEYSIKAHLRD